MLADVAHCWQGQFAWLDQTLAEARAALHTAYIIGHIPPGKDAFCTAIRPVSLTWDRNASDTESYVRIMREYGDVVKGEFFGHTHTDLFRLTAGTNTTAGVYGNPNSGRLFVAGSVSPIFGTNPRFRLWKYNPVDYQLLDYTDYVKRLDLDPDGSSGFVKDYTAIQRYREWGLKSLSTADMSRFLMQMKSNESAFEEWYLNVYGRNEGQKNTHPIPRGCKKQALCAVECVLPACYAQCMQ